MIFQLLCRLSPLPISLHFLSGVLVLNSLKKVLQFLLHRSDKYIQGYVHTWSILYYFFLAQKHLHRLHGVLEDDDKQYIDSRVLFLFFFVFLGPNPRHMEVPRLGVQLELWLLAYATGTAMPDASFVCSLHHSAWQHWILNPLRGARDRTCVLMHTSQRLVFAKPRWELQ